jgi:hypothetical protein
MLWLLSPDAAYKYIAIAAVVLIGYALISAWARYKRTRGERR